MSTYQLPDRLGALASSLHALEGWPGVSPFSAPLLASSCARRLLEAQLEADKLEAELEAGAPELVRCLSERDRCASAFCAASLVCAFLCSFEGPMTDPELVTDDVWRVASSFAPGYLLPLLSPHDRAAFRRWLAEWEDLLSAAGRDVRAFLLRASAANMAEIAALAFSTP